MKTPLLETERLILRPISLDDAPAIQKYFNNWNIIQHLSTAVPWPYPDDGAETFIRDNVLPRIKNQGALVWVIIPKSGPEEAIGIVDFGLDKSDHGDRGFWIAEAYQNQGLMSEAITHINDYLFFELGIERFKVVNAKGNIRSRRVKEKTGAQFIGYTKLEHHSGETESEMWEVTKDNWQKLRNVNLR